MLLDFLQIRPEERPAFSWSAAWFSTVLAAYYIVRPVREALGSIEGARDLPYLFTAVFITMLVAVPLYAKLVSMFSRRQLVPVVYRFLAINLLSFAAAMFFLDESLQKYVARVFFVWVTVYVLFMTSLFWSVMADVFTRDDGKRLFGTIAGFGTVGAILASLFVGITAEYLNTIGLLLMSVALMEVGLWCFRKLNGARPVVATSESPNSIVAVASAIEDPSSDTANPYRTPRNDTRATTNVNTAAAGSEKTSTNPFSGFIQVVSSPYLRSIMLYVFCTTSCGTFLYLTQAELLREAYPDNQARTAVFAKVDLAVQIVTVIFQVVVASRLMNFSLKVTLCCLPLIYGSAFLGLAVTPSLTVLFAAMILSRSTTYGLAVPALGVLYTVVSRDDKYKAKSIIDTLVIRGGDVGCNWTITALRAAGMTSVALAWMMLPVAGLGIGLAFLLGHRNAQAKSVGLAAE